MMARASIVLAFSCYVLAMALDIAGYETAAIIVLVFGLGWVTHGICETSIRLWKLRRQ